LNIKERYVLLLVGLIGWLTALVCWIGLAGGLVGWLCCFDGFGWLVASGRLVRLVLVWLVGWLMVNGLAGWLVG
jgi:hypothetical protein